MAKAIDNFVVLLLGSGLLVLDHYYGSQFAANLAILVTSTTQHYNSDRALIALACVLLVVVVAIYWQLRRLDRQYVSLTCTPQLTPAEYDYLAKKTTIEKLRELKSLPQYKKILERSKPTLQTNSDFLISITFDELKAFLKPPNQDHASYSRRSGPTM